MLLNQNPIEQWGMFEVALQGPDSGNPFLDVELSAQFRCGATVLNALGFYNGDGVYKIRCMPTQTGAWTYVTASNQAELDGKTGNFTCVEPADGNHGPVVVHNRYHFAYADGTPYYPFGTTCYAWVHQGDELEAQTLKTLAEKPFNKIRTCVFPKHYPYNRNEPRYYPFVGTGDGTNDFTRFDPAFFHHLEQRIAQLCDLGIEADLILWHPYDRWGYAEMDEASDVRYLRYLIARFAAYRNIWWSLANEYDFMLKTKPMERWQRFFQILVEEDPYQHLRSIHNGDPKMNYDHTRPEVTHVCIQHWDVKRIHEWRKTYQKPVIDDELEYEGNIPLPWGNIHAEEVVHRFWIMLANGGYAGHGETYVHPDDILWWSKGGVLHGQSWKGIGFLRQVIESMPAGGLTPIAEVEDNGLFHHRFTQWYWTRLSGGMNGACYLIYLGEHQMAALPVWTQTDNYAVQIIDTRAMTISDGELLPFDDSVMGHNPHIEDAKPTYYIKLPSQPYLAVRIQKRGAP